MTTSPHDGTNRSLLHAVVGHLPNGALPLHDVATAGQLQARHVEQLANAGVRMVLDLRPADEPHGFDEVTGRTAWDAAALARSIGLRSQELLDTALTYLHEEQGRQ